ncbi:MAG: hypothetical protein OEZ03_08365 [Alphaproteobacteria bacterium]|nr:hypothetical protein [Alphaproteobacteria bacterium]
MFKTAAYMALLVFFVLAAGSGVSRAQQGGTSKLAAENEERIDFIENNTPGGVSGCASGQIAKFVNDAWVCSDDVDTVGSDTNAATICETGTVLTGDGECRAYPLPRNVVFVPGDDGPFVNGSRLLAALAEVSAAFPPPSEDLPYVVKLSPGIFHLGFEGISVPSYVTLQGAGKGLTRIESHPQSETMVTMADHTSLRHLSIFDTACETFIGGDHTAVRVDSSAEGTVAALYEVEIAADTSVFLPEPPGTPGILCTTFGLIFGNGRVSLENSRISAGHGVIMQSVGGGLLIADHSTIVADPRSHSADFVAISAGTGGNVFLSFSSVSDDIYVNQGGGILARVNFAYSKQEVGGRLGTAIYTCVYSYEVHVGGVTELLPENCASAP